MSEPRHAAYKWAMAAAAEAPLPFERAANRMDAPNGPECRCGRPSRYEDGCCAACRFADAADIVAALLESEAKEIASLRAALAAEREAHEAENARRADERQRVVDSLVEDCDAVLVRQARERDAAIARAETAERERDAFRAQAEASLVVPCACGRPMPSVSSRLRCDACRAEGERDEARAACVAMREAARSLVLSVRATAEHLPPSTRSSLREIADVLARLAAANAAKAGG